MNAGSVWQRARQAEEERDRIARSLAEAQARVAELGAELITTRERLDAGTQNYARILAQRDAAQSALAHVTAERDLWKDMSGDVLTGDVQSLLRSLIAALGMHAAEHEVDAGVAQLSVRFLDPETLGPDLVAAIEAVGRERDAARADAVAIRLALSEEIEDMRERADIDAAHGGEKLDFAAFLVRDCASNVERAVSGVATGLAERAKSLIELEERARALLDEVADDEGGRAEAKVVDAQKLASVQESLDALAALAKGGG